MSVEAECGHCPHYHVTAGQLFDTAIELDEMEGRAHRLEGRLREAIDALVWCLARIDNPPAWIHRALEDAEAACRG